jgi:hypothetical protein
MPGRSLPSLVVFCALAVMTLPVQSADLSPEMRGQIEAVVKSYLLKNPEIIRGAVKTEVLQRVVNEQRAAATARK